MMHRATPKTGLVPITSMKDLPMESLSEGEEDAIQAVLSLTNAIWYNGSKAM